MFRLVKIFNECNNTHDTRILPVKNQTGFPAGCALTESSGVITTCALTAVPEYISIAPTEANGNTHVLALTCTEGMIFQVEYIGVVPPTVGMKVGIIDSGNHVNYNGSGKGIIVDIDPTTFNDSQKRVVYVRFRKS